MSKIDIVPFPRPQIKLFWNSSRLVAGLKFIPLNYWNQVESLCVILIKLDDRLGLNVGCRFHPKHYHIASGVGCTQDTFGGVGHHGRYARLEVAIVDVILLAEVGRLACDLEHQNDAARRTCDLKR